jgi:translation initiation factor 1
MRDMSRKDKAPVQAGNPPELNSPFAGLEIAGLPPGPAADAGGIPKGTSARSADAGRADSRDVARIAKPGRVVLRRETAHRGGKVVIVIDDFAPHIGLASIEELGRRLRNACGCGGTIRGRRIELQGNQAAKIRSFLEEEGFRVAGVS